MLSLRRSAVILTAAAMMQAQPALTTIRDILYRADGTRFNGEIFISWNAFQAGDTSNIATAQVKLPIVNGVLSVQLVPTTTASVGANYQITYNGAGVYQFSQTWAVPPSSVPLRVADVLVSTGTVVGGGAGSITSQPIQISDVVGLTNALALVPQKGVAYALGRAAVINNSGQIDGAAGNLGDCVRVDGSSGPCGGNGGGLLPLYADGEVPSGAINGLNTTFTLASTPSPSNSLMLYVNGLLMHQGLDYTIAGSTITFALASTPQTSDVLLASYRYANPNNPLGSLTAPQVVCSAVGTSTSNAASTTLGTCTLPAGLLGSGDRIEVRYHFRHSGTSTAFTPQVVWGGTPVLSRTGSASDTALAGRLEFSIEAGAQPWSSQSFGSVLPLVTALGVASVDITQNLTIIFLGQMSNVTTDALELSNYTVVRYPGQINP
ncbi:MAG TPA: hypothetical protein VMT15_18655 [Bryobacteraceae bacterium]|nr:hypothetical protein [Bryobacteraceae bacterium]